MKTPQIAPLAGCTPLGLRPIAQDQAELAKRKAAAPLKPAKPQAACDVGLFSDDAAQSDLVDMARKR